MPGRAACWPSPKLKRSGPSSAPPRLLNTTLARGSSMIEAQVYHGVAGSPAPEQPSYEPQIEVEESSEDFARTVDARPGTRVVDVSGREGEITAADLQVPEHYEVMNPDLHLATMDSPKGQLHVELSVEPGRGYVPAGQADGLPIGVIPVDAIFSPVRKVNYRVGRTRVGQETNFDRLEMEVWTDGTISAAGAASRSGEIIMEQFRLFAHMGQPPLPVVERGLGAGVVLTPEKFNMPIEDLNLSMRAYNCLRRSGLMTMGQVLEKSKEELLSLRTFGRKSYEELREKLNERGLLPADRPEDVMEAPPIEEGESPIIAQRPAVEEAAAPEAAPAEEETAAAPEEAAP